MLKDLVTDHSCVKGLQGTLKVILKWEKRPMSEGVVLSAQDERYIALEGGPSTREYTRLLPKK